MPDPEFHADVIRRLGGKAALCRSLGIEPVIAGKWHVRGIPSHYWHRVVRVAESVGGNPDVTAERLAATKPATKDAA